MAEKLVITAALTGALASKQANQPFPIPPRSLPRSPTSVTRLVHPSSISMRETPRPALLPPDPKVTSQIIDAIRQRCPELTINMSSGITGGLSPEQRIAPILANKPDMASLNTSSMNFAVAD